MTLPAFCQYFNVRADLATRSFQVYIEEHQRRRDRSFFKSHGDEEWFKEKYQPDYLETFSKIRYEKSRKGVAELISNPTLIKQWPSLNFAPNVAMEENFSPKRQPKSPDSPQLPSKEPSPSDPSTNLEEKTSSSLSEDAKSSSPTPPDQSETKEKDSTMEDSDDVLDAPLPMDTNTMATDEDAKREKEEEEEREELPTAKPDAEKKEVTEGSLSLSALYATNVGVDIKESDLREAFINADGCQLLHLVISDPIPQKGFSRIVWAVYRSPEERDTALSLLQSKSLKFGEGEEQLDLRVHKNTGKQSLFKENHNICPPLAGKPQRLQHDLDIALQIIKKVFNFFLKLSFFFLRTNLITFCD